MEKIVLETVDSTNAACRRGIKNGNSREHLIISERQTAGRGTKNHHWDSEKGGLYCTWYMGLSKDLTQDIWVSVFAALGIQDYFSSLGIQTNLKWPNDILLQGRKVGGLLAERFVENGEDHLMLGMGINFLQAKETFAKKDYLATSVLEATGMRLEPLMQVEPLLACIKKRRMQGVEDRFALMISFLGQVTIGKEKAEKHVRRMYETTE
ncbi:biotin--[acetyl-CoA-carboxylase] ligase [Clostridia bacterium]|nr:biotin--[acetyl-CoA-carboxylase] ligase [Clostridia bacterium]